jgi:DNA-binding transcriptional LysR family regulator
MRLISQQLRVFDAVARRRSFTRAARELKMTQPAVTHHMRVLEEMCGIKLVERSGNQVVLTPAGMLLYESVKQMIGLDRDLCRMIDELRGGERGRLTLGTNTTGGMYVMLRILRAFRADFPEVDVRITVADTASILDAVLEREVDMAIVRGPVDTRRFVTYPLCPDELIPVVSADHPLVGRPSLSLHDLADEPLILPGYGSTTREYILQRFRDAGLHVRVGMEFSATEHIKKAVEFNLGVAVISRWVVERELGLGILVMLDVEGFPLVREYQLVTRRDTTLAAASQNFIDTIERLRPELRFTN